MISRITILEALNRYYSRYATDLERSTLRKMKYQFGLWSRMTDDPPIDDISRETFDGFRRKCIEAGKAAETIESTINSVLTVISHCVRVEGFVQKIPDRGRRLKKSPSQRPTPALEAYSKLHDHTSACEWPKLPHVSTEDFWKSFLVVAYFTALRLSDLMFNLKWSEVSEDRVEITPRKTGIPVNVPMHPVLKRHLDCVRTGSDSERVFPVSKSPHLIRREIKRMCKTAGVSPVVTPHAIRRLSASSWDEARYGAGPTILGRRRGVADRYIVPLLLRQAVECLAIPENWMTAEEREGLAMAESRLMSSFRRLPDAERRAVSALAEKLAM